MTKSERIKILEIQVEALQRQVKELQASGRWWSAAPIPADYPRGSVTVTSGYAHHKGNSMDPFHTSTRTVWLNSGDCDDMPPGPYKVSKELQEDREDIADAKASLAEWEIVNNKSYGNTSHGCVQP